MTKAERDALVNEGLRWLREDHEDTKSVCRLPGCEWDEKVMRAILEASLLAHPAMKLIAVLGAFRLHWVMKSAPRHTWLRRWENWIKRDWDPLITGVQRQAQSAKRIESDPDAMRHAPCAQPTRPQGELTPARETVQAELAKIREKLGG